jgi:hypothetical protein
MEANATTQDNCRRLVDEHIHQSVSYLVQELGGDEKYRDDLMEVQVQFNVGNTGLPLSPDLVGEEHFDEALEHWLVSEWLGKRLLEEGEMVIEFLGLTIWGRTTSGQAIYIDSVIEDIYNKNWA